MTGRAFRTVTFNPQRVLKDRLFPDEIELDSWVVYHGTSATNSALIERDGFRYDCHPMREPELKRITGIFDAMRWAGNDKGGYAVLESFSAYDFSIIATSPIYLTERSIRALLYATRDFAGGEKLRGVRRAIADLRDYLKDAGVRTEHMEALCRDLDRLVAVGAAPSEIERVLPIPVDLGWLEEQIKAVATLDQAASQAYESFPGGVVYGVRLRKEDATGIRYTQAMGIEAKTAIPPERIVCKMSVPSSYERPMVFQDIHIMLDKMNSGLIAEIAASRKRH